MAVQFEFYKNPVQGEEEGETSYHPRVVNFQHVTTQRLAAEIHWQLPLARPKWKQC